VWFGILPVVPIFHHLFHPEEGGSMVLRNADNIALNYITEDHCRTYELLLFKICERNKLQDLLNKINLSIRAHPICMYL
jgi:hypothetical protein